MEKRSIGIGYVIIPTNVNYIEYINTCFKTKTVSIITEDTEVYHSVRVGDLISKVEFPDLQSKQIMGSTVIFIRTLNSTIPTIISLLELADSGSDLLPNQWRVTCKTKNSSTSLIQGDSEESTIDIVTHSLSKSSEITLRATSKMKNSIVKVESDGEIYLKASSLIRNHSKKIELGSQDLEPALLGDQWKSFMKSLYQTLKQLKTIPSTGVLTPDFLVLLEKNFLDTELEKVLSETVEIQ